MMVWNIRIYLLMTDCLSLSLSWSLLISTVAYWGKIQLNFSSETQ